MFLGVIYDRSKGFGVDIENCLFPVTVVFVCSFLAANFLLFLLKKHQQILNLGWKRLLLVINAIAIIPALYVANEIERISNWMEAIFLGSMAIAAAYACVMSVYFGVAWIADGFKQSAN